jgi:hypothetical protein
MQPQYPPQQYAPPMPQYPQQPYAQPAPAPAYPPAYPQQPAGYPQGYAQPQYAPAPPAAPQVPLPTGSLDTFYQQPSSSGGPSFKFLGKPVGTSYAGFVARPVTDADVRADTDEGGNVRTYKDGRPKFVMIVPMLVQQSQEFPDGQAGWWVKGQARDELARAMAEAGAPAGAPEGGAFIQVTLVAHRPVPNRNPQFVYRVVYQRPNGAPPPAQPVQQVAPMPMPQQGQAPTLAGGPNPFPQPQIHPEYTAAVAQQPNPYGTAAAPVALTNPTGGATVPQPGPQPAPAPVQAAPSGFTEEQAALFAKLTGQQAAA